MRSEFVQKAVSVLKNDGVIIHPTDTCYGLACSIFSQKALEKLYRLKQMPFTKPVSILVSSLEEAKQYGEWNKLAEKLAAQYWPGPLTIVMNRKDTLPHFLNPEIKTIGIRFPNHELSLKIIRGLGYPISTTSANITGQPASYNIGYIQENLKADFIIHGGKLPKVLPSTFVDISQGVIKIIRQGPVIL